MSLYYNLFILQRELIRENTKQIEEENIKNDIIIYNFLCIVYSNRMALISLN